MADVEARETIRLLEQGMKYPTCSPLLQSLQFSNTLDRIAVVICGIMNEFSEVVSKGAKVQALK